MATVSDYTQLKSAADIAAASGFGNGKIIGVVESGSLKQYEVGLTDLGSGIQMADGKFANQVGGNGASDAINPLHNNATIIDSDGNYNHMVWVPRFNLEDINAKILANTGVDLQLGTGAHPAFNNGGTLLGGFYVCKYNLSDASGGGTQCIPLMQPKVNVSFDTAKSLCTSKGAGWHLLSIHECAAVALWSIANETQPRGNTNYGRSHVEKIETGTRADNGEPGDVSGTATTKSGSGPATWSHSGDSDGIFDLVGNTWEFVDGIKLVDGEFVINPNNNPESQESSWVNQGSFLDAVSGVTLSNSVTTTAPGNLPITSIQKAVGYTPNQLLRQLLIEFSGNPGNLGRLYMNNSGERVALRGGLWASGVDSGLGAINLSDERSSVFASSGFRAALFV